MKLIKYSLILSLIIFLVSCTNEQYIESITSSSQSEEDEFPTPEESLSEAFTALKNGEFDTLALYIDAEPSSFGSFDLTSFEDFQLNGKTAESIATDITVKLYKMLDFTVVDSITTNDTAIISVILTTPDGENLVQGMVEDFAVNYTKSMLFGEVEMQEITAQSVDSLIEKLSSSDIETMETETDIKMIKGEDHWIIVPDEKFFDDITGGTVTASKELMDLAENFVH